MHKYVYILLVIISTVFTVVSSLSLKYGLNSMNLGPFQIGSLPSVIYRLITNIYVAGWFVLAAIAMVLWVWAVAKIDLSLAYPFLSVGYIFIIILSKYFLNEDISSLRWIGVILMSIGLILISRN